MIDCVPNSNNSCGKHQTDDVVLNHKHHNWIDFKSKYKKEISILSEPSVGRFNINKYISDDLFFPTEHIFYRHEVKKNRKLSKQVKNITIVCKNSYTRICINLVYGKCIVSFFIFYIFIVHIALILLYSYVLRKDWMKNVRKYICTIKYFIL